MHETTKEFIPVDLAGVEASDFYLALFTLNFIHDPRCMMQLATAIFLDKPILLVVKDGTKVPVQLQKIAYAIEYFSDDKSLEKVTAKIAAQIKSANVKLSSNVDLQ